MTLLVEGYLPRKDIICKLAEFISIVLYRCANA